VCERGETKAPQGVRHVVMMTFARRRFPSQLRCETARDIALPDIGTVVHLASGAAALGAAFAVGPRRTFQASRHSASAANWPLVCLGCGLLWFGWLGFNAGTSGAPVNTARNYVFRMKPSNDARCVAPAGSALAANGVAAQAVITTNAGAASAMLTYVIPP
jgi:Amt family ammonium transporter